MPGSHRIHIHSHGRGAGSPQGTGGSDGLQSLFELLTQGLLLGGREQGFGRELHQHQTALKPEAEVVKQRLQQLIEQLSRL